MQLTNFARAALFSVASLVGSPVFAQGEQCVRMKNDIARLQCFDAAFSSYKGEEMKPTLTINEAFGALLELVRYQTPDSYLGLSGFEENMCALQIQTRSYWGSYKGYKSGRLGISQVDLRKVESIPRWGPDGPVLNFERNSAGVVQSFSYRIPDAATLPELTNYKASNSSENSSRTVSLYLIVPEYKPDKNKIKVAFENFWKACQK